MFFLLLTQQVAVPHAFTHWIPAALASAAGEERVSSNSDLRAHACELCAAAQYASPIPGENYRLRPPEPIRQVCVETRECATQAALTLAFHSRAPPRL